MASVYRQPASTIRGAGLLSDGDRVIGEARYCLQIFHVYRTQCGPAGKLIQRREREVYGDGELLRGESLRGETTLSLHLRDGRSFRFAAIPNRGGRGFEIVPDMTMESVHVKPLHPEINSGTDAVTISS